MTYEDDPLLSVREAAAYLGVTTQGVRACVKAAGVEWEWQFKQIQGAPREVMSVRKSVLDTFRSKGFLVPRRGRRPNGETRAKLRGAA